jgi:DNA repair exonuclease SbcCD ATPase subunit
MKFPKLIIENFLTIGRAEIDLSNRGLVLIQGVNNDDTSAVSNGAGKSSIADAICWCLYGTTARGESGDAVINEVAKKDCKVSVRIEDGPDTYVAVRHRKHKDGKNALWIHKLEPHAGWTDLTQGTDKLTQEVLDRILDRSYDVFRNALYAGQDQMPNLPGMTDKQLKVLVEEAAGTMVLEQAYAEARTRMNLAKSTFEAHETKMERACDALNAAQELVKTYEADFEEWTANQQAKIDAKTTRIDVLKGCIKGLTAEIEEDHEPKADLMKALKDVDASIAAIAGERIEEKRLEAEVNAAARASSVAKSNLSTLKVQYDARKRRCEEIASLVGTPCGECGKQYCEHDLEDASKIAEKNLADIVREFKAQKAEAERLINAQKQAQEALETFQAGMTDLTKQNALRASLDASIRTIVDLENTKLRFVSEAKAIVLEVQELKKEINPFKARIADQEKKVENLTIVLSDLEAQAEELDKDVQVTEKVVEVFGPKGVRAHILDEVTPYLNDQTAKYLGTLSDGNISATWSTLVKNAKGELKEKFSIEVGNAKGGSSFGLISGGEKRKVRIAAALALQDLVATRSAKPIDLFIGDEIDDALDVAGQERLMMILEEKARERGTVLLISHNSLRDWVSQVMTVTKTGRVSTIEETVS